MKRILSIAVPTISFLAMFLSLQLTQAVAKDKDKDEAKAEEEVVKLEHEWAKAYITIDTAVLERVEADDYIFIGADGDVTPKAQDIKELKTGVLKLSECTISEIKVRAYGKTAIATGISTLKGTYTGKDISGKYRFTDVFVRSKGVWHAVSTHASLMTVKK
jgi:ketosteroid isomerase-like protein